MKNDELAIALAKAETEEDVISILKDCGYWDDYSRWMPFGDNSNNYSIIGNQQSSPDAAFVEKIINSIDACLNGECLKHGINPMGPDAPQSMEAALQQFYNIKPGGLKMLDSRRRSELAQNIIVAATGEKSGGRINLCIADKGEGQTPKRMPETILSISKSNKLKIPFVQGKFNMGGTGALPFCGKHHLQLVISKRCPDIPNTDLDDTYDKWSVTVVRKEAAREGRKSSMYTYLTDVRGKVLTFDADSLPIIPLEHVITNGYESMDYGTYIKLYNYQFSNTYKSALTLNLSNRLSLLIPNLALPIRLRECRNFNAHSNSSNLIGLVSRLYDDRSGCLEDSFPSSGTIVVDGQKVPYSVYLFKKDKQTNYRAKHEGVLFTVNGQTQGILNDRFFNRMNLSYIKDSILVIADCGSIDIAHQEELFMTSRDRLRDTDFSTALQDSIEQQLRTHEGLKKAANERRSAALQDKLADNKPLKDVLQNIFKKSPVLSKLFIAGQALSAPFSGATGSAQEVYNGKLHPTFFALSGKIKDGKLTKNVPCNKTFRVQFTTDVQNDYFSRPAEAGSFVLQMDGEVHGELIRSLNLYNGVATLTLALPDGDAAGNTHVFETSIQDEYIVETFENSFSVNVTEAEESAPGTSGGRIHPVNPHKSGKQQTQAGLAMPEITLVKEEEWETYGMDCHSALVYLPTDNGGDYFLNMDNICLLTELKCIRDKNRIELVKAQYTYSMALIGMSVISYYKEQEELAAQVDIPEQVKCVSSMLAPVLIPMLESMANLSIDDLANAA